MTWKCPVCQIQVALSDIKVFRRRDLDAATLSPKVSTLISEVQRQIDQLTLAESDSLPMKPPNPFD